MKPTPQRINRNLSDRSNRLPLMRNKRRGRFGGIAAGIGDYFGIEPIWIRLAMVASLFFSFGITLGAYVFAWVMLPIRPEVPIPQVDRELRRELKRMDRIVRRAHRSLPLEHADQVQNTFDALKLLAGDLQSSTVASQEVQQVWDSARRSLPRLIGSLLGGVAEPNTLVELRQLELELQKASRYALGSELAQAADADEVSDEDSQAWRNTVEPLREQLKQRVRPQTLAVLQGIESKLTFLLSRSESSRGSFDLEPFKLHKIAYEYLPEALQAYLQLPTELARSHSLPGGITAEESLNEQLIRLDKALEDMATSLFERDAQALLIHGRFLRNKFADNPFKLDQVHRSSVTSD